MCREIRRTLWGLVAISLTLPSLSTAQSDRGSATYTSEQPGLYSIFVAINVSAEHSDDFLEASLTVARESIREEGALRYDVLRDANNPNRFYFYEIFRDRAAAEAHWGTAHFDTWRTTVADMVSGEFEMLGNMKPVFPSTETLGRQKAALSRE